jgi:hypothetical protein
MPRWIVDIALTIHYYEAILACLAILVWHFYHVIFDPDVYPANWAAFNGKVSAHWHEEEHSLERLEGGGASLLASRETKPVEANATNGGGDSRGNGCADKPGALKR